MDGTFTPDINAPFAHLRPAANRILEIQTPDGAIPWFEDGAWDPWNHVESAMALTVMGEVAAAAAAFDFLQRTQRPDGAWFGEYANTLPMIDLHFISRERAPAFLDSNFCAYPAVGVAHFYLVTEDLARVRGWWPMVRAALDFVISLQRPDGTILWSVEALGTDEEDALLAGNASIAKSLECGLYLAALMDVSMPTWQAAHDKLLHALKNAPELFDRRGTGKRFAMDWYYPVLSGALSPSDAKQRLNAEWNRFVVEAFGCRCVSDEPWITVAETGELILALIAAGETELAHQAFETIQSIADDGGVFWMGWQTEEKIFWPQERPAWTQAAIILAADALENETGACRLLTHRLL